MLQGYRERLEKLAGPGGCCEDHLLTTDSQFEGHITHLSCT